MILIALLDKTLSLYTEIVVSIDISPGSEHDLPISFLAPTLLFLPNFFIWIDHLGCEVIGFPELLQFVVFVEFVGFVALVMVVLGVDSPSDLYWLVDVGSQVHLRRFSDTHD